MTDPSERNRRLRELFLQCFFRDPARPIEWLSILALAGFAQVLFSTPDLFERPAFSAFRDFSPAVWGFLILAVVVTQLVAMWPVVKAAPTLRFVAMALASGLWTVVAISYWQGEVISTPTRTYSAIAFVTALTGVYLGWTSSKSR